MQAQLSFPRECRPLGLFCSPVLALNVTVQLSNLPVAFTYSIVCLTNLGSPNSLSMLIPLDLTFTLSSFLSLTRTFHKIMFNSFLSIATLTVRTVFEFEPVQVFV